jgi:hypothetical protein
MEIQFSSSDTYPIKRSVTVADTTLEIGAQENASDRVKDYLFVKAGVNAEGYLNPIADPFLKDVQKLSAEHAILLASLEIIAMGKFTSTDKEPQYAGGVVSPGNRIFTPQEAAKNALEMLKQIS